MLRNKRLVVLSIVSAMLFFGINSYALGSEVRGAQEVHVDIPVVIKQAKVVFNIGHPVFAGDLPVGINYMHLLAKRFKEMGTKGKIIGVFHGDAAYMVLKDDTYNAYRHVSTGNPYKARIAELIRQGVQIEECAMSMRNHQWGNDDLLSDVKVNTGAVGRVVELVQQGYVQIQP